MFTSETIIEEISKRPVCAVYVLNEEPNVVQRRTLNYLSGEHPLLVCVDTLSNLAKLSVKASGELLVFESKGNKIHLLKRLTNVPHYEIVSIFSSADFSRV